MITKNFFLFAFLLIPTGVEAAANIDCKAMKLTNSSYSETKFTTSTDRDGLFTARARIEDCYYAIQGLTDRNRYSVILVLDEPKPKGTGIFSDGTFDGDGYMRLSFVIGDNVYKLVCSNKAPLL